MCVCFPIIFYCHSSNMGEQIVHKNLCALRALNIKRIGWGIWDPFAGSWSTCSYLHKLQKLSCLICISLAYIFDFISLRKLFFLSHWCHFLLFLQIWRRWPSCSNCSKKPNNSCNSMWCHWSIIWPRTGASRYKMR